MTSILRTLLDRVEKMAGPDYQMHDEIASHLYAEKQFMQLADAPEGVGCWMYRNGDGAPWESALRVTASVDAVIGCIKDLMPPAYLFSVSKPANWSGRKGKPRFEATVSNNSEIGVRGHVFAQADGATPELALLAALLRAKIAQEERT